MAKPIVTTAKSKAANLEPGAQCEDFLAGMAEKQESIPLGERSRYLNSSAPSRL